MSEQQNSQLAFIIWFARALLGYAVAMLVFVLTASIFVHAVFVHFIRVAVMLFLPGLVALPLIYFSRRPNRKPTHSASGFAFAVFLYMSLLFSTFAYLATRLNLVSGFSTFGIITTILFASSFAAGAAYFQILRQLEAASAGGSLVDT